MELVATHFLPWKSEGETTHSIRFCSALSWFRRFLYTVSASVESSTSKGILKGEQIILVWMKLLKTIRTITTKMTKTMSTIDYLCSEESPSKRLASIQVVSSGYSTNLPNHPLQHQDTNIKIAWKCLKFGPHSLIWPTPPSHHLHHLHHFHCHYHKKDDLPPVKILMLPYPLLDEKPVPARLKILKFLLLSNFLDWWRPSLLSWWWPSTNPY